MPRLYSRLRIDLTRNRTGVAKVCCGGFARAASIVPIREFLRFLQVIPASKGLKARVPSEIPRDTCEIPGDIPSRSPGIVRDIPSTVRD